jgi:hypothetical protein
LLLIWALCRALRAHTRFLSPVAGVLVIYLFSQSAATAWDKSLVLNPSYVRIVDALASIPADLVLANYWDTKPIYLASGNPSLDFDGDGDRNRSARVISLAAAVGLLHPQAV